jgi:CHASE2 domain-containing sensor protein
VLSGKGRGALADPAKYSSEDSGGSGPSSGKWKKRLAGVLACAVVAALYLSGGLEFAERQLDEIKFDLLSSPATEDVVVVEIDARSITDFGIWPWPRSRHAALVNRLVDAGASRIAFDVDFSAYSTEADDAAFAQALAASGGRVVLPVFRRMATSAAAGTGLIDVVPVGMFRRHVALADLNVIPSSDGRIRHLFAHSTIVG